MAKYIKQEMTDLNGTGKTQAYYRMQIDRNLGFNEFVDCCTRHGGMQRSAVVGVIAHVCHELALQLAEGYSVTIEGLGTFKPRLGVRRDKAQDAFEEDETHRNVLSLEVNGISYRADKDLIFEVDSHCSLERGHASRLRHSKFTLDERIALARQYLKEHTVMRTVDYAAMTGLSLTTATRELRQLSHNAATGIVAQGRRSAKVYLLSTAGPE